MRTKMTALTLVFTTVLCVAPFANAGQDASNVIPTNLLGVTTSIAPPLGFDPLTAPDEELAAYGFPPRPDAESTPEAYASWARAMAASKERVLPRLRATNIFHGPNRRQLARPVDEGTGTSSNWSGPVVFSGATSYNNTTSFWEISTEYVVPVAEQAFGVCNKAWDYGSAWVGIDGDGSNDVLQAGVEFDASCSPPTAPSYSAWYEWFPYSETQVTNLPVSAGDDMLVIVWATSATSGHAYIVNYNTKKLVTLNFTAPPGTSLVGNCAEWIVERPGVNGALATLTNYIATYFSAGYAYNNVPGNQYVPGSPGATLYTMLDNNGKPISFPTLLGTTAIWFQDEGSAW